MITKENFQKVLEKLEFNNSKDINIYIKPFPEFDCDLKVDFKNETLIYPEEKGFKINERQTCNFKQAENFVVFECVHKLLLQGYSPKHIELEPKWQLGHGASGGRADILVKGNDEKALLIIECKTAGNEFIKAWKTTQTKPTQLFSYYVQARSTKFIALYASDFIDDNIQSNYYLINITDNDELLKNNLKLKSYKDATEVEDIYKVWVETYEKDFSTLGLFENNKPYEIGKTKFTSEDLKNITSKDIQGKYHEFATILRQHNVSGRENAFDKLVNLFLCKVTDETTNKDELKFYWKGRAYDNPFDFQDRLQQLYKNGMEKFLGETITYIDNNQIDEAFNVFKDKENEIKKRVKEMFTELKFFTNSDFAFIDVHNDKLFYQNFEVLLKISRMIQDISLTSSDENQFLGDMFEGFLDQGVKQSEGQFFTPMPIVKFIINSLPNKENPNVIDYACGAGHFLNEYASINKTATITGIEKEYRLSKVAKVSSFMYGSDINIIYDDALSSNEKIKNNSFDVLIANPPYSVKGFLETLNDEDRAKYELISTIEEKSFQANNSIECFFIEKSKQLLKSDGVAGIIVPSSILNKGSQSIGTNKANVYVRTREIILKYFDIVSIAEFGSGTFGKTGTNTVTLFLKRKSTNFDISEHLKNIVEAWFECDFKTNESFIDSELLKEYCKHLKYDFEVYKTLLCENLDYKLFDYEIFKEYKIEFEKLTDTKNRRKTKTYIALDMAKKDEIEKKELIKFIKAIENEKLYYFCLACKNSCDVVIVKSPSDGKENKKFLGYEWSSAKGNEGIHYLSSSTINIEDENLDDEDKRILENLSGLKHINTPLYNPQYSDDVNKINKIIKDNFNGIKTSISTELETYVNRAKLVDMLDFNRVEFNKSINLSINKKVEIESKYPLVKLDEYCENITKGTTPTTLGFDFIDRGINFIKIESILQDGNYDKSKFAFINEECNQKMLRSQLKKNDILFSIAGALGRTAIVSDDILPANTNQAISIIRLKLNTNFKLNYLYQVLRGNIIQSQIDGLKVGIAQPNLSLTQIGNFKIPLPPLEIQEEIIKECQKVDDEVSKANEIIEKTKKEIENEINSINDKKIKLSAIAITNPSKREISNIDENTIVSFVEMASVSNEGFIETKIDRPLKDLKKGSFTYFAENDIIIAKITPSMENGKCAIAYNLTNNLGMGSSEFHVIRVKENIDSKYLFSYLNREIIRKEAEKQMTGASGHRRVPISFYENLQIPLPPLETQKEIISKIEKLEANINEAKKIVNSAKEKKEEILKEFLQRS
ncbi:N-6 DNA methylase [Aliarcobacter cryaerophilus]|uniref:N-6 DNA methylase n=1 Tax=Aliarcobacter cryaerophilus TaxID=28198 RepID=UPI0021B4364D|nr:N-6 DNA methylase [Aliarcobacter cryaerophilus]MCT7443689.1 N-6 DNA methylase [Aliarcobacter cryaerophilus]MCT7478823.1 N-6 DNA methylase [Aliarcobacter cryaerophilus]